MQGTDNYLLFLTVHAYWKTQTAKTTNGKASRGASAYSINLVTFGKRLKMLYSHWNEYNNDLWGASECLKSSALNVWLVGYEFPDTIMVFMKKQIHFLFVKKTVKEVVDAEVVMHVKTKNDDGTTLMDSIFRAVRAQSKLNAHDTPVLSDITNGFSDLFAVKDIDEITNVKKAAYLTLSVMKHFVVPMLEKVIDEEKKVSHSSLMDDTEKAENIDICYPPIFQSEEFDFKPSASSNNENLYYDFTKSVANSTIGSRYNSYCSNVARTFLIDANAWQNKAYEVLLKAHDAAISALKSGNKAGAAYEVALSVVEKDAPELIANLTKSAGTGIGLEFQESELSLNRKNDRVLKPGMVFNVSLGFQNLQAETKNPKTQKFSVLLSGTVIVGENSPEVVTTISSKAVKNVSYSFIEDEEEEEQPKSIMRCQRRNNEVSNQAELARQKNKETARRLAGGVSGMMDNHGVVKPSGELITYKNFNDLPTYLMIQIDQRNEAILSPIYGSMAPFHVAVVKSVSSQQDTNHSCYIRIIFNVPGTPFNPQDTNSLKFHSSIYIKEVSFCTKDPRHISEVVQLIKTLYRQVASRESEKGAKFKPIRLSDLWIRPVFGGPYTNGFWYSTSRSDECAEIMFANIKHAFFQPAETEMITLLHFHLHNHIMVGNKKPKDMQFYVEVMDVVQTLGGGKRSAYDLDEIEEEQREDRKNKINMDFQNFPFRDLGFHGVPHKASAFIVPTSSCLVELIETPYVVITLNEIDLVNLERVGLGQKNFDMTVVFKDFKRDVFWTDSIPSTCLDGIKEWLDTIDLKYYESRLNLNWRPILKTITDDPEKFIEDGGWEFLNMETKGMSPQMCNRTRCQRKRMMRDTEEVSEEEEGKTWEELEREASKADREKGDESDSEDKRKRRKIKPPFGKAQVPDKELPVEAFLKGPN
ncbi:hypothetical protein CsSME_00024936 [Camellia sinensis var. sinensis]